MSCIIQPALLQTAFVTVRSVLGQIGLPGPDTPLRCVDTDPAWRPDCLPGACWERTMANVCFCLLCHSQGEYPGKSQAHGWPEQQENVFAEASDGSTAVQGCSQCRLVWTPCSWPQLLTCCVPYPSMLPRLSWLDFFCPPPSMSLPRSLAHYMFPFLLSRTWLFAGLHLFILRTPSRLPWPLPSTLCLYQVRLVLVQGAQPHLGPSMLTG